MMGTLRAPGVARGPALLLAASLVAALLVSACGGRQSLAHRPGWQIHARLVFLADDLRTARPVPPRQSFRLWFPYVVGDLYGAPGTGDFVQAAVHQDGTIDIDLGATERDLVRSLEPTDFYLRYLHIVPANARIARLAPAALQANGIDPIGRADWVDLDSHERLMLVYADRPARIVGQTIARGTPVHYDIRFPAAGYVWIAGRESAGQGVTYSAVPAPRHLALAVTPKGG